MADEEIIDDNVDSEDQEVIEVVFDELAPEVQMLVNNLTVERDEAQGARQRALADYANFQRRASENEKRARDDGGASVLRSLIPVLDQFDLALEQPVDDAAVGPFLEGMRMVRDELRRAMEQHGVTEVRPDAGAEFDPNLHQALMRVPTDEYEAGRVVAVMQAGYARGEYVLRAASVSVATEPEVAEAE